ncbi:tRNA 2-selenouridine(34) synthase MnmH [Tumebacillus permanentifrigoris]|uniref:tRNA 2-selenouridine synthase n=1 Tax=Tumebacillus permanentifrigoris TaxID=378543 RepID=A0A316DC13_9BACL|nr:tRNA 2-selenouridine(34) synthase MnmH [Tumebacillus permanentifrigoris]PWK15505.1 tRNA 2-selenouridine synthase [Tumebacillus permanentifrigoris]
MGFQEIEAKELYDVQSRILVDVRSPGEFAEGSIPGSVNVPLFTNEERAYIGTVYKQESPAAARRLAMLTVSPKIPQIVEQMEALMKQGEIVVFCWRGGMRSYAACTFMQLLKYPVKRLRGGYRAYRQLVLEQLDLYKGLPSPPIVLHGMTGVGKTRLLLMLKERGHQVLDLEQMANHRGSVFGWIGLGKPNNQKMFDSFLWESVREFDPSRPIFMEAESRRIGHSVMPQWLEQDKIHGVHVLVEAGLEHRVERLMDDYLAQHDPALLKKELGDALQSIQKRIPRVQLLELQALLESHAYAQFCGQLLELYYDPKYLHKLTSYKSEMLNIDADDLDRAVLRLEVLADQVMREREKGEIMS